jgi:hypothetical protein
MLLEPGKSMGKIKKTKVERTKERKTDRTKEIKREAILPLQVLSREDYLTAIILSTLTFVVYSFTAAPGVTLEDSGDFIMGVLTLGIVHPPGYPLYTVLGHLFSLLPFGDPAFGVNLFSALWGSLCLGVVFLILRMLSIERIHAVFATLLLGFTSVFWSQTGTAEVYSFNVFLTACIFFWILSYNRDKKKSQLYLIFLTTGLALSNHYPLVILSGVGLAFLLDRRHLRLNDFAKGLIFLGLGLTPYLYLFIQALDPDLQYNFGKLSDFDMVLGHILREYYPNIYIGTIWDKFGLAFAFLKLIITNYFFASLILFFGIAVSFIEKWKYRYPLLIAALSSSLGLILILTFPNDEERRALFAEYSIPAFMFLSVFLGLGLNKLMNRYVKNNLVQCSLLLFLLISQVGFNFAHSTYHKEKLAEIWGTDLLNSLEPDAILVLCFREALPIYYLQFVKGIRQDVTLHDRFSLVTQENLYGTDQLFNFGKINQARLRKIHVQKLINNSVRPIYYSCKNALDEEKISFSLTPFSRLLDSLLNTYPKSDYWLDHKRRTIFGGLISYYGGQNLPEINKIIATFKRTNFYSDPEFLLSMANNLYFYKNYELAGTFYKRAEDLSWAAFSRKDLAFFCLSLANGKNYDKALQICIRHEKVPTKRCDPNKLKTQRTIREIYNKQGNLAKVEEYSRKMIQCRGRIRK